MATHYSGPLLFNGRNKTTYFSGMEDMPVAFNLDTFAILDDFALVGIDTSHAWTVVKDASATVAIVADTVGGELSLTSAATTDNDGASIQGNEVFAVTSGKRIYFQTRVKCNDADQTDICLGLTPNFTTNPEAMLAATDRIVFQIDDESASILCKTEKDGVETSTDSGVDLVDNTYVVLAFAVNNNTSVSFYINGALVATHSTNIPDDENLAIGAMSVSGSASGTRATVLDYLFCAQTR